MLARLGRPLGRLGGSTRAVAARRFCTAASDGADNAQPPVGPSKLGTPSPWANDAWSDRADEPPETLLSESSFAIPLTAEGRASAPSDKSVLDEYEKRLQRRSASHMGYPYNLNYAYHEHDDLHRFLRYSINNLGDPFEPSNYGVHSREFECAVIDFFAQLWKAPKDDYWGYVTTCGTEGNLHGMLLARECHPEGVLYTSRETHYSILKAARYYKMDYEVIDTLPMGEIDYDELGRSLVANKGRPAIINVNIGTTVKGAVDNLDRVLRIVAGAGYAREDFHIHCDGALLALMIPFFDFAPEVSFNKPIDSITVSGHKMLGCPMPCGVALTLKKHVKKVEQRIDYLNSVDTTIMGSRNGQAALFMWHSLRKKGLDGIKADVEACIDVANYLRDELNRHGVRARLNDLSTTVVLERPIDQEFVLRWQLACEEDIAHVVVMPNITKPKIDVFVNELVASIATNGPYENVRPDSPLSLLDSEAWGGKMEMGAASG